jgi:Uma2 family endonuclease
MSIQTDLNKDSLFVEEDMPESQSQINLSRYLMAILQYLFRLEHWFVTGNLAIYPPNDKPYPFMNVAPDLAVFIGTVLTPEEQVSLTSWRMSEPNRSAPDVVFEISLEGTWPQDLDPKPTFYGLLGVKEYFAYDPQNLWRGATSQLRGWRYVNQQPREVVPDARGWLWSEVLDSWLVPDGPYLRLYDAALNIRLTGEEAERFAKEALLEKLRKAGIDPDSL